MTQGKIKLYPNSWNTIVIPINKKVKEYLVSKIEEAILKEDRDKSILDYIEVINYSIDTVNIKTNDFDGVLVFDWYIPLDYHQTDIHQRLLYDLVLNIEILLNDKDKDISEYDIQAFMVQFLRRNLDKDYFLVHRESFGKYDGSISYKNNTNPNILYELKTFIKPHEKLQTKRSYIKIKKDFEKLKNGVEKYKECRGYFVLVCKDSDLTNILDDFKFLKYIVENKSKKWISQDGYKLRPSRKVKVGRTFCFSWEVK